MDWTKNPSVEESLGKTVVSQGSFPTFHRLASWCLRKLDRFPALVGQLSVYVILVLIFNLDALLDIMALEKLFPDFGYFFYLFPFLDIFSILPLLLIFLMSVVANKLVLVLLPGRLYSSKEKLLAVSLAVTILLLWLMWLAGNLAVHVVQILIFLLHGEL